MRSRKDGGFAWLVSGGAFIAMFLETGMVKSLGVLLPVLREQFTTHTWVIGLVISLAPGFGSVTCILASALNKRFSPRLILIFFSLLSSLGLFMGCFATSVGVLTTSVFLTGFSFGAEAITLAILPDYFDKYYDISNGIAHAGLSVGIMVMPLLTQFLLDAYGWRGTILLLGGLNLHILLCAALLRPLNTGQAEGQYGTDNYQSESQSTTFPADIQAKSSKHTAFNIKSIIYYLDLTLFKNVNFVCLVCMQISYGYYFTGWLIYLVPHALDIGFKPYHASSLATVGGIGNLAGALVYPFLTKVLSVKALLYLSTLITSLALAIDPILSALHSYIGLILASSILNFGNAVFACCVIKEVFNVIDENQYPTAVNWIYVAYSVGSVSSGFLSGWLFDRFGSYTMSFIVLSAVTFFSLGPRLFFDIRNYLKGKRYSSIPYTDSDGE